MEPKPLTEAEWREVLSRCDDGDDDVIEALRERGLIAPEPVDPLLVEAREIEAVQCELNGFLARARQIRSGEYDDGPVRCILMGLRRGMELAALPLAPVAERRPWPSDAELREMAWGCYRDHVSHRHEAIEDYSVAIALEMARRIKAWGEKQ